MTTNTTKISRKVLQKLLKLTAKTIALVKENGAGFVVYAAACDIFDEIVLPAIMLYFGHPVLAGVIGIGDLDWLTYPLYFAVKGKLNQLVNITATNARVITN